MGMYDTVLVPCPLCSKEYYAQSKSGPCRLNEYELDSAPPEVLENVNRHAPFTCETCETVFFVRVTTLGIAVETVPEENSNIVANLIAEIDWMRDRLIETSDKIDKMRPVYDAAVKFVNAEHMSAGNCDDCPARLTETELRKTQAKMAEIAAENVAVFSRKSPKERFEWLVRQGLVDRAGNLTIRVGGDAQPDPSANQE